jgi:hypothetical protein
VLTRLQNVLTEPTPAPRYSHLSAADRQNIREILSELLPEFAATTR